MGQKGTAHNQLTRIIGSALELVNLRRSSDLHLWAWCRNNNPPCKSCTPSHLYYTVAPISQPLFACPSWGWWASIVMKSDTRVTENCALGPVISEWVEKPGFSLQLALLHATARIRARRSLNIALVLGVCKYTVGHVSYAMQHMLRTRDCKLQNHISPVNGGGSLHELWCIFLATTISTLINDIIALSKPKYLDPKSM